MYIHEHKKWPHFTWDQNNLTNLLSEVRYSQGYLLGRMEDLGFHLREEALLTTLTLDVLKTSEIEGEKLDTLQVRSSIAKHLGIDIGAIPKIDRHVEGIVAMMLDATGHYTTPLTTKRLFSWHKALFPTGSSGLHRITVDQWRTDEKGPMQVISGPIGREKIHYVAPKATRLKKEMTQFLTWFNDANEMELILKSAIAHFWFVSIHPFDDGNGRIARAIADMVLARAEKSSQRFYSMSAQIQHERNEYYYILEHCQTLDITSWIEWYLNCLKRAFVASEKTLEIILNKAHFWKIHTESTFNERQRKIINRLLDHFKGKLTSSKWAKINKCSQDTALRDINDLLERGILKKDSAGGRSTSYHLNVSK